MNRLIFIAAAGIVAAPGASAQLTRGYISGAVRDASGAIVAGTAVRITNLDTNLRTSVAANEEGVYRFVAVEPGRYRIEFAKTGFEERQHEPIDVASAQEVVLNEV